MGELTVRETFDFAARCMGAGTKKGTPGSSVLQLLKLLAFTHLLPLCICLHLLPAVSSHRFLLLPTLLRKDSLDPALAACWQISAAWRPWRHC